MTAFVDASAIVAILTKEDDADSLIDRLERHRGAITSAIAVFESALGIARKRRSAPATAAADVKEFLDLAQTVVIPITERETDLALDAFARFGEGRHRAALNMGDCFAYACAKAHGVKLLCKGDDFTHTDIAIA
ncbi:type II toxin-antitoxin system VapC family toxin [soil metagenome]